MLSSKKGGICSTGWNGRKSSLGTSAPCVALLLRTVTAGFPSKVRCANVAIVATADSADGSSIAKVRVDSHKVRGHPTGSDILNHNLTRAVGLIVGTVAAAAIKLTRVGDGVIADRYTTATVVLDNFVLAASGTTTFDKNVARSTSGNSVWVH
jgi:hypothetical protein